MYKLVSEEGQRIGRLPGKDGRLKTTSTRLKSFLRRQPCVNKPHIDERCLSRRVCVCGSLQMYLPDWRRSRVKQQLSLSQQTRWAKGRVHIKKWKKFEVVLLMNIIYPDVLQQEEVENKVCLGFQCTSSLKPKARFHEAVSGELSHQVTGNKRATLELRHERSCTVRGGARSTLLPNTESYKVL